MARGQGMGHVTLGAGRQPEHLVGLEAGLRKHPDHAGPARRQRARLVEDDRVDAGQVVDRLALLEQNASPGGGDHRGQHGGRERQADAGAEVDDQDGDDARKVAGEQPRQPADGERRHHEPVGDPAGALVDLGIGRDRILKRGREPAGPRVLAGGRHLDDDPAVDHRAPGQDLCGRPHLTGERLAGPGPGVDQAAAFHHGPVDRDGLPGIDHHELAGRDLGHRTPGLGTGPQDSHPGRVGAHPRAQHAPGPAGGTLPDALPGLDQRHRHAGGQEVAGDEQKGDGRGVEHVDVQPAAQEPAQCAARHGRGADGDGDPGGHPGPAQSGGHGHRGHDELPPERRLGSLSSCDLRSLGGQPAHDVGERALALVDDGQRAGGRHPASGLDLGMRRQQPRQLRAGLRVGVGEPQPDPPGERVDDAVAPALGPVGGARGACGNRWLCHVPTIPAGSGGGASRGQALLEDRGGGGQGQPAERPQGNEGQDAGEKHLAPVDAGGGGNRPRRRVRSRRQLEREGNLGGSLVADGERARRGVPADEPHAWMAVQAAHQEVRTGHLLGGKT